MGVPSCAADLATGMDSPETDTAVGRPHVFVAAVLLAVRRPQSDAAPLWEPGRVGSGSGDRSICARDGRACAGVHARGTVVRGTRCVLAPVSIDSDSSASPVISTKSHGRLPARTPVHAQGHVAADLCFGWQIS